MHTIDPDAGGPKSIYVEDVDGDGDKDFLAAAGAPGRILWWESDGTNNVANWTERVVDDAFTAASSVYAADMDGDGDMDILGSASFDDDLTWWENRGGQFALPTADIVSSSQVLEGSSGVEILAVTASHGGRPGDTPGELANLELLLKESPGDPLSAAEANALIDNLHVCRFIIDPPFSLVNTLETLSSSPQIITFADDDPDALIPVSVDVPYFIHCGFIKPW